MKVNIENKEGLKKILSVSIDKIDVQKKIDLRLEQLSKEAHLKGFRPGKAPKKLLRDQFGKSVYGEVIEKILQETTNEVIKKNNIRLAGQPKIDIKSMDENKDLQFNIEVDSLPEIKLQELKKYKFKKYQVQIDEKTLSKKLNEIAKNNLDYVKKENNSKSENGDLIIFNYSALVEKKEFEGNKGEQIQLILGRDLFIPGFDKNLLNLSIGSKKTVSIKIPENFPNETIRNKTGVFQCEITDLKKPTESKIDDNLAKKLGAKDLNDLKQIVKKNVTSQYESVLAQITNNEIYEELKKEHSFELPKNMIDQELQFQNKLEKDDKKEVNINQQTEKIKERLKLGLILNEYGVQNGITVNENDLNAELQKLAQTMPGQEKLIFEYYNKTPSALTNLRASLFEKKVIEFIKSSSSRKEIELQVDEAEKLIKDLNSKNTKTTTKSSAQLTKKTDKIRKKIKK